MNTVIVAGIGLYGAWHAVEVPVHEDGTPYLPTRAKRTLCNSPRRVMVTSKPFIPNTVESCRTCSHIVTTRKDA